MQAFLWMLAFILSGFAILTWNQPMALMALAGWIEHWAAIIVRELRVRALAKEDAMTVYRRAALWHRGMLRAR